MLRAQRVETRAMRHDARRDTRHLDHLIAVHDRHGRPHGIAVQVEVDGVYVGTVGRDLHRGRERPELHLAYERVATGRVLPLCTAWRTVRRREVVEVFIGRRGEAVRTGPLRRVAADTMTALDRWPVRPPADEGDVVVSFTRDEHEVGAGWRLVIGRRWGLSQNPMATNLGTP